MVLDFLMYDLGGIRDGRLAERGLYIPSVDKSRRHPRVRIQPNWVLPRIEFQPGNSQYRYHAISTDQHSQLTAWIGISVVPKVLLGNHLLGDESASPRHQATHTTTAPSAPCGSHSKSSFLFRKHAKHSKYTTTKLKFPYRLQYPPE